MRFISLCVILAGILAGCSGTPLDVLLDQSGKHSTDLVSEVTKCYTGLAVDSEAGEYLAIFDKGCVDAVLGVSQTTQPEGVEIIETDLSTVLSSFSAGETDYLYKFVQFDAVVDSYTTEGAALYLRSAAGQPRVNVRLFVKRFHIDISQVFSVGESYRFLVWNLEFSNNTLFCRTVDPADVDSGRTLFDDMGQTLNTTVDAVVESMKAGETYFVFKRIMVTAPVQFVFSHTTANTNTDYQTLILTPEVDDIFHEKETHTFFIYPSAALWEQFGETYEVGITYTFELIVHPISGRDFFDEKDISVVTYLAE